MCKGTNNGHKNDGVYPADSTEQVTTLRSLACHGRVTSGGHFPNDFFTYNKTPASPQSLQFLRPKYLKYTFEPLLLSYFDPDTPLLYVPTNTLKSDQHDTSYFIR